MTPALSAVQREEAVKVLQRARAEIVEHGWCQNRPCDFEGRICLGEALERAARGGSLQPAWSVVRAAIDDDYVTSFNDTPGRTVDEVLAVLDRAEAALKGTAP